MQNLRSSSSSCFVRHEGEKEMKLKEIKEAIKFNCGCEYCGKGKMEWTFNQTLNAVKEEIQLLKKQMAINPREEQIFDIILENIESTRGEPHAI